MVCDMVTLPIRYSRMWSPPGEFGPLDRLFVSGELVNKPRVMFSGGWTIFAISNDLRSGDRFIFSLKAVCKFVVYI